MKRIGLFLCAVVLVAVMTGCNGSGGTESSGIIFTIELGASCTVKAVGTITSISKDFATSKMSLSPGQSLPIDLPEAGTYRIYFYYISGKGIHYWDKTQAINDGDRLTLTCN